MMNEHGEQIDDVPPASRWRCSPRRRALRRHDLNVVEDEQAAAVSPSTA